MLFSATVQNFPIFLRIDTIINEYLKHSFSVMSNIYVKLFNIIFDNGCIPELWLSGNIIPLYKNKGDKLDPSNFRPLQNQ
jgi:hypothetical protein